MIFFTREVDSDETRSNILRLTEHGRGVLSGIHEAWGDIVAIIAVQVGAEKATQLEALTLDLRDTLGSNAPGRPRASKTSLALEAGK